MPITLLARPSSQGGSIPRQTGEGGVLCCHGWVREGVTVVSIRARRVKGGQCRIGRRCGAPTGFQSRPPVKAGGAKPRASPCRQEIVSIAPAGEGGRCHTAGACAGSGLFQSAPAGEGERCPTPRTASPDARAVSSAPAGRASRCASEEPGWPCGRRCFNPARPPVKAGRCQRAQLFPNQGYIGTGVTAKFTWMGITFQSAPAGEAGGALPTA